MKALTLIKISALLLSSCEPPQNYQMKKLNRMTPPIVVVGVHYERGWGGNIVVVDGRGTFEVIETSSMAASLKVGDTLLRRRYETKH